MIRIRQVKVLVSKNNLKEEISKKLRVNISDINDIKIVRKSIDSRCKPSNFYVYEVDVSVNNEDKILNKIRSNDIFKTPMEEYSFIPIGTNKLNSKINDLKGFRIKADYTEHTIFKNDSERAIAYAEEVINILNKYIKPKT